MEVKITKIYYIHVQFVKTVSGFGMGSEGHFRLSYLLWHLLKRKEMVCSLSHSLTCLSLQNTFKSKEFIYELSNFRVSPCVTCWGQIQLLLTLIVFEHTQTSLKGTPK